MLETILHLAAQVVAAPILVLLWATPANLIVAGMLCAPAGMLWAMAHGYPPKQVAGRALHWITAPAVAGALLVLLGADMGAWHTLSGWEIGAARGAAWGAIAAGLRLALLDP